MKYECVKCEKLFDGKNVIMFHSANWDQLAITCKKCYKEAKSE